MNVKYIFLFTLYVVLPNGLCSQNLTTLDPKQLCTYLNETWNVMSETQSPFMMDEKGNVLIKILVKSRADDNYIFVTNVHEIGVAVKAKNVRSRVKKELIKYLASVLETSELNIDILGENTAKHRTVLLKVGCGIIQKEAIDLICRKLL